MPAWLLGPSAAQLSLSYRNPSTASAIPQNGSGQPATRTSATGQARDHHSQALAIAREIGAPLEEARALEGIGHSHLRGHEPIGGPVIRWTTTGCVALLALIAGTVSYLHVHLLVELHGRPGWVAALTPLSVDGMIVAASTTLLADSRAGERGGVLPWALLVTASVASLTANVAVAEPTAAGRVSIAGVVCYRPGDRPRLSCQLLVYRRRKGEPKGFTWQNYRDLIIATHQQLAAPLVWCWDYVARHIIPVVCPAVLCGQRRLAAGVAGGERLDAAAAGHIMLGLSEAASSTPWEQRGSCPDAGVLFRQASDGRPDPGVLDRCGDRAICQLPI